MLSHDKPILVIAEERGEEEAVMRLGRIGFGNVAGYKAWLATKPPTPSQST